MTVDSTHDVLLLEVYTPELLGSLGVTFHDVAGVPVPDDGSSRRVDEALDELVGTALGVNYCKQAASQLAAVLLSIAAVCKEAIRLRRLVDDAIAMRVTMREDGWEAHVRLDPDSGLIGELELLRTVRKLTERFS